MTDLATPGEIDAAADNRSTGHALQKGGVGPWVVDGVDISDAYTSIDTAGVNAFAHDATASAGLDAVFDGGEAYVAGWLVRDTQTTVTLPDGATTTVYVGYDPDAALATGEAPADSQNVIVGQASAFGVNDPRTPIYDVTTAAGAIDTVTDRRLLQQPLRYDPGSDQLIAAKPLNLAKIVGHVEIGGTLDVANVKAVNEITLRDNAGGARMREATDNFYISPYTSAGEFSQSDSIEWDISGGYWDIKSNPRLTDGARIHGLLDNSPSDGAGVKLHDVAGDPLPSTTETGRLIYDSSRET